MTSRSDSDGTLGAFLAVALYGIISLVAEHTGSHLIPCIAIGVFIICICIVTWRNGWLTRCGIRWPARHDAPLAIVLVALSLVPAYGLVTGLLASTASFEQSTLILLMYAAFLEELFFRGFLIGWLRKRCGASVNASILLCAGIFALLHLVNLGASEPMELAMQVMFAFACGVCFGCYVTVTRSIIACVLVHALINASSLICSDTICQFGALAVSAFCALWLYIRQIRLAHRE